MYEKNITNLKDLEGFAKKLSKILKAGDVFLLHGDLGAGKTTLTQQIAKNLKITSPVTSPTFNLVNFYNEGSLPLYHVDLYRLESPEEIESLDLDSFLYPEGVSFIEWAKRAEDYMPRKAIEININFENGKRILSISGNSKRESEIVEELKKEE